MHANFEILNVPSSFMFCFAAFMQNKENLCSIKFDIQQLKRSSNTTEGHCVDKPSIFYKMMVIDKRLKVRQYRNMLIKDIEVEFSKLEFRSATCPLF